MSTVRPDQLGIRRGLIIEAGGTVNSIIPIPAAISTVGRDPGADIFLPYDSVSHLHLRMDGTGPVVFVADAHSTNGSWINDRRLEGWTELRDGDRVTLGSVTLRYFDVSHAASSGMPSTDPRKTTQPPRDSSDPMKIKIGNNTVSGKGSQNFVEGDQWNQTWKQKVKVSADYDPADELFSGEGPGRGIAILGVLVALGGFAWFASHIFGFIGSVSDPGSPIPTGPPPTIGYAFATFLIGGVIYAIGIGMSKARRKRKKS